ncbi:MAG: PAS domain S-box protein [Spirochaetales bacterium]|nr:PAS domain S-box protein [Spirochaetales bacterium]
MSTDLIYILSYIVGGVILTIMIVYLWIFRKMLKPGYSLLMFIAIWIWLCAHIGEAVFTDFEIKFLFNKLQFFGIIMIPASWFTFCFQYQDTKIKNIHKVFLCLFSVSALFLILIFTNEYHHLIWERIYLGQNNLLLEKDEAAGFYFLISYFYGLIISGYVLLFIGSRSQLKIPRNKIGTLIIISLIPLLAHITDIFFTQWLNYYEITPLGFVLSSLSFFHYLRLRFYKIIPLTQHTVIESMNDLIIILNATNLIIYINPAVYKFFSTQSHEVVGKHLSSLSPQLVSIMEKSEDSPDKTEEITIKNTTFDASISSILNWRSYATNKVLVLRDITKLKQTEESLKQVKHELERHVQERTQKLHDINKALKTSLEEKNMLFGELHHRVKNNFQLICSMLKLQSYRLSDKKVIEAFGTAINRIYSIAMIHEKLYRAEDFVNTKFSEYVKALCQYITSSYEEDYPNISLKVIVEPVLLDLDRSIICGLIINELIINAIKHAFTRRGKNSNEKQLNEITVRFHASGKRYILSVADNGVGLAAQFDIEKSNTLGMKIIQTLIKQIRGTFEVIRNNGTEFKITFQN